MGIKPIETHYKGYRFRSRLEARWAVFFDALGIEWEYEKEGYDLGEAGWYLPDFWLPTQQIWVEIKPLLREASGEPKWPDDGKPWALAEATEYEFDVVVLCGTPGPVHVYDNNNSYTGFVSGDWSYYWCECPACGALGIQFDGRAARNRHSSDCTAMTGDKGYNMDSPRLLAAYAKARSARFEHGEHGL